MTTRQGKVGAFRPGQVPRSKPAREAAGRSTSSGSLLPAMPQYSPNLLSFAPLRVCPDFHAWTGGLSALCVVVAVVSYPSYPSPSRTRSRVPPRQTFTSTFNLLLYSHLNHNNLSNQFNHYRFISLPAFLTYQVRLILSVSLNVGRAVVSRVRPPPRRYQSPGTASPQ